MSAGHLSQRRDGGRAPQTTFTRRYRAPVTQVPTAPHQTYWPDWPQLARAMASPIIWALTPFNCNQQTLDMHTDSHDTPLDLSSNPTYGYKSTSSSPDIFWEHFRDIVVHTVPTSNPDIRYSSNGVTDSLHDLVMLRPYRNKLQTVIAALDLLAAITLITALLPEIQLNTSNLNYLSPTWFNPYNISETIKWNTNQYLYRDMNKDQYVQVMTDQLNILTQMIVHKTDLHLTDIADLYMCKFKLTDDQIDRVVRTLMSTKSIHSSQ